MKAAYIALLAVGFGIAAICGAAAIAAAPSVHLGNYLERLQWERGESGYQMLKNDLPFEVATVHKEVFELAPRNNLILLGSSNTRDAIWPQALTLPDGWNYHNLGISGANVTSLRLLLNFLNDVTGHPPNKTDVVVVNLWYVSLQNRPLYSDYLKSDLEMFGHYKVEPITPCTGASLKMGTRVGHDQLPHSRGQAWPFGWPHVEPGLNSHSLRHALELLTRGHIVPDEKPPKVGTPEAADAYRKFYGKLMERTRIPGSTTDELMKLLRDLKRQTNVVVINLYSASWHEPSGPVAAGL